MRASSSKVKAKVGTVFIEGEPVSSLEDRLTGDLLSAAHHPILCPPLPSYPPS